MHSASCIRNLGLLAIGSTLLTILFLILSNSNGASIREYGTHPKQIISHTSTHHYDDGVNTLSQVAHEVAIATHVPEPPKKERGNILVILPKDKRTGGDFGFKEGGWLERAISNRKDYADLHGYKFIWEDLSTFQPEYDIDACWAKIAALQHSFDTHPDVEWMWMLDSDAIILNSTVDLWEHLLSDEAIKREAIPNFGVRIPGGAKIEAEKKEVFTPKETNPDDVYLIIAADGNGINAGSFFIRRNPYMSALIDFWKDPYLMQAGFGYREQDALAHLMVTHDTVIKHTAIVKQKLINEYIDRLDPGDFVVHFAGCIFYKDRDCDKLFTEQWEKADKPKEMAAKKKEESEQRARDMDMGV